MAKIGSIGVVRVSEKPEGKEYTAPQVIGAPQFDSRLRRSNRLPYWKIREIRKDPTVKLMREVILAPAVHTEWTIVADENAPSEAREFIRKAIFPHRLRFLQRAFNGCAEFGWMPFEKVLKEEDGNIVIDKLKPLLHDYTYIVVYLNTGDFAGFINYPSEIGAGFREVFITEKESMNINFETEGTDWYGQSIYEAIQGTYDDWVEANNSAKRYNKKVAGAHWIIYYPAGKTPYNGVRTDNQEIALDVLTKLESNGAVIIPDEIQEFLDDVNKEIHGKWRVELLSDSSNTQITFTDRQKYVDNLKVRAFGIPERAVLEGKFGTKAEAEVHSDIGLATIDTKHRVVVSQLNEQCVDQLMLLNFGEKAVGTVRIQVAPLVDSRFAVVKEVYRMLLQSPNTIDEEAIKLDTRAIREELSLPSLTEAEVEQEREDRIQRQQERAEMFAPDEESEETDPDSPGQNPRQTEENDADKA